MKKPYVILNAAMTLDGKIATSEGNSEISCREDKLRVHGIRAEVDAIMVGINTAIADDPKLTSHKIPGAKDPVRVIIDSTARLPLNSRVFGPGGDIIVAVSEGADTGRVKALKEKGDVISCGKGEVDLRCLLEALYKREIETLLLEGGGNLNWSMLNRGLVDEVRVAISPRIVGGRNAITLVEGTGFERMDEGVELELKRSYPVGREFVLEYAVKRRAEGE